MTQMGPAFEVTWDVYYNATDVLTPTNAKWKILSEEYELETSCDENHKVDKTAFTQEQRGLWNYSKQLSFIYLL
jgi:hypothetical protein